MVLQGFNTLEQSTEDFIEFCERLEFSEEIYDSSHVGQKANVQKDNNNSPGLKASAGARGKKRKARYYCLYHGNNTTHNTDDCKVLKAQAEKMAAAHANVGAGKYKKERPNETKKGLESFKAEIVRSVIDSLSSRSSSESAKCRKVTELDNFNLDLFNNLDISEEENDPAGDPKDDSESHSTSS